MSMPFWPAFIICVGTLFCSFFPSSYVDFVYFLWQSNFLLFTFRGDNISCTFRSVSGPAFHNVSFLKNVRCFCEAVTNVVSTTWHPPPALPSPWTFSFPCLQGPRLTQFQISSQGSSLSWKPFCIYFSWAHRTHTTPVLSGLMTSLCFSTQWILQNPFQLKLPFADWSAVSSSEHLRSLGHPSLGPSDAPFLHVAQTLISDRSYSCWWLISLPLIVPSL